MDLQDSVWDSYHGTPVRRGTFNSVIRALDDFANLGITTYVKEKITEEY